MSGIWVRSFLTLRDGVEGVSWTASVASPSFSGDNARLPGLGATGLDEVLGIETLGLSSAAAIVGASDEVSEAMDFSLATDGGVYIGFGSAC